MPGAERPRVAEVIDIVCEAQSPPGWLDRTAFDAQVTYRTRDGTERFIAIETKYTEPFSQVRYDRPEYRELIEQCGWFTPEPPMSCYTQPPTNSGEVYFPCTPPVVQQVDCGSGSPGFSSAISSCTGAGNRVAHHADYVCWQCG